MTTGPRRSPAGSGPRALLISAARSGAGKTVITLGLLRAFSRRGARVAGAKSGPDYIDPGFHAAAVGAPSRNLDAWAMTPNALRAAVRAQDAELLLIEGAMGLIDGAPSERCGGPVGGAGSAADLAEILGIPAVLVVDAAGAAQSAALSVVGARALRPQLQIAGVVLNRVASARHADSAGAAIEQAGFRVFGAAPRAAGLATPSRHLGLTPARERPDLELFVSRAAETVAAAVDLEALAAAAAPCRAPDAPESAAPQPLGARIAVAEDAAFAFAYPHLMSAWRACGAEILPFSPLEDAPPDASADAVFLPGGYPELHAGRLAAADGFRAGMRAAAARGAAIYGECGGYMALGRGLVDADGRRHAMLDLLPVETSFAERRLHLGYRRLAPRSGAPFAGPLAGHEFHYATEIGQGAVAPGGRQADALFDAFDAAGAPLGPIGRRIGRVSGSFAHVIAPWPTDRPFEPARRSGGDGA